MNEKIRELMMKATKDMPETYYWPGQYVDKFAELIVKETLQVARAGIAYGDGMEDAVYKYFGVEE